MSPELQLTLQNDRSIEDLDLLKSNVFSLGIILL